MWCKSGRRGELRRRREGERTKEMCRRMKDVDPQRHLKWDEVVLGGNDLEGVGRAMLGMYQ